MTDREKQEEIANSKIYELGELAKGNIYPATIIRDAHSDVSGVEWLAFQLFPHELPEEAVSWALDTEKAKFWAEHDDLKLPIGKGNTPNEALEDLKVKAKKHYESW